MKKFTLLMATVFAGLISSAQSDSTVTTDSTRKAAKPDTIRIGSILIINKGDNHSSGDHSDVKVTMGRSGSYKRKNSKISTNWGVLDFGISNYDDQTNYANTGSFLVNKPGSLPLGAGDFKLRSEKSINVNIWLFMQRISLYKNYVNLKYGFGLELNNYRYRTAVSHREGGLIPYSNGQQTSNAFIFRDSIGFTKNKLAADYFTVPLMLNFATNPHSSKKGVSLGFGVSAGYLYSDRNKQISADRGKIKYKGELEVEKFKFSYIAELGIGPIRLYGSYSPASLYDHSLDMKPYTVGFRFSTW